MLTGQALTGDGGELLSDKTKTFKYLNRLLFLRLNFVHMLLEDYECE